MLGQRYFVRYMAQSQKNPGGHNASVKNHGYVTLGSRS